MGKIAFTVKRSIKATSDLKPPDCEVSVELDFDDVDIAVEKFLSKNLEAHVTTRLEEQLKYFDVPMKSMQKDLDKAKAEVKKLDSGKVTDLDELHERAERAIEISEEIEANLKTFNKHLGDAVKNIKGQQLPVWIREGELMASKKFKTDLSGKKRRVKFGVAFKGLLVVGGVAAGVIGTIVTFGAAPVAIAAIAAACAGISGLISIYKTGKEIDKNWNMEKRALKKLSDDLKEMDVHLGKVENKWKGLPKHLKEASQYYNARKEHLKTQTAELTRLDKLITEFKKEKTRLKSLGKNIEKLNKEIENLEVTHKKLQDTINKISREEDKQTKELFDAAKKIISDFGKIDFAAPRKVSDYANHYCTLDNMAKVVGLVGSVNNSVKGIKKLSK